MVIKYQKLSFFSKVNAEKGSVGGILTKNGLLVIHQKSPLTFERHLRRAFERNFDYNFEHLLNKEHNDGPY